VEGHLAWFVLASVQEMDLDAFYGSYREDGWGRAAFEPWSSFPWSTFIACVGANGSKCSTCFCIRRLTTTSIMGWVEG